MIKKNKKNKLKNSGKKTTLYWCRTKKKAQNWGMIGIMWENWCNENWNDEKLFTGK